MICLVCGRSGLEPGDAAAHKAFCPGTKDEQIARWRRECEAALASLRAAEEARDEALENLSITVTALQEEVTAREAAEGERDRLRQAHWDGRRIGGFDNDGDPTPRAIVSDFAGLIRQDWEEMRGMLDAAYDEIDKCEAERDEARAASASSDTKAGEAK